MQQIGAITALEQGLGQAFELRIIDQSWRQATSSGQPTFKPWRCSSADVGPRYRESKVPVSSQAMPRPINSTVSAPPGDTSD